jgi:hypothetical protein
MALSRHIPAAILANVDYRAHLPLCPFETSLHGLILSPKGDICVSCGRKPVVGRNQLLVEPASAGGTSERTTSPNRFAILVTISRHAELHRAFQQGASSIVQTTDFFRPSLPVHLFRNILCVRRPNSKTGRAPHFRMGISSGPERACDSGSQPLGQ